MIGRRGQDYRPSQRWRGRRRDRLLELRTRLRFQQYHQVLERLIRIEFRHCLCVQCGFTVFIEQITDTDLGGWRDLEGYDS
jgi:hypothetical protein